MTNEEIEALLDEIFTGPLKAFRGHMGAALGTALKEMRGMADVSEQAKKEAAPDELEKLRRQCQADDRQS